LQLKNIADKYGTPLYVYDFDYIASQFLELKEAFKARKSLLCYAIKANSNLSVIKKLSSLGSGADCVSIGEVKRALIAGVPKYMIIFSGVGKREDEIVEALQKDILMINLESEAEMELIEKVAKNLGVVARISIRVNPNIDPKTHPYISTGLHENKFGVDIDSAKRLYIKAKNSKYLEPIGIHFHIGSQLTDLSVIKEASLIVADLLRSLIALKIDIKFFDVGGGIGVRYKDEETIKPYDYAQAILETLQGVDVTIVCEPGRFLTANSGYFLTKVLYEKQNDTKRFVIVDGGMNDLIRPTLYKVYHETKLVNKEGEESLCDVVGPICESGDYFAKNIMLPSTNPGDLVVVKSVGAYGFTMAGNYNTRPRVAEVAVEGEKDRLIRKRESFEKLIEDEVEFL
jgi:diaminopimelate decarboxylase